MFIESTEFEFLNEICENYQKIIAEISKINDNFYIKWPEIGVYDGNWRVFPFYKFGEKIAQTCAFCPQTTMLIENIPNLVTAGISRLSPNTEIKPHYGYTKNVLRFHLGLIGGENCGIKVGDAQRGWHPGSAFVFDDTQLHSAWNRGASDRLILLLDFKRDASLEVGCPEHLKQYGFN